MAAVLDAALAEKVNLTAISLGMLVKDVWERKVKKQKRDQGSRFINLKKRTIKAMQRNDTIIHELNDAIIESIRVLFCNRPGWIFNSSLDSSKSVTLTRLLSPHHREAVTIDGHYVTIELKMDMARTPSITISTCRKKVSLGEIIGVDIQKISLRSIDEAMCLVENAPPCIGYAINADDESRYLKLEVAGSNAVAVTSENLECCKRLVSTSCLLFRFRGKSCNNCLYIEKLYRNRSSKRKLSSYVPPEKCNLRFMHQEGLERKIKVQRKIPRSDSKRELIELVDEDNLDLMEIVKSTNIADVPSNLVLLWEEQMKQLSMKSSNGYRWDPRC